MSEKFKKFVSKICKEISKKNFPIKTKHRMPTGIWLRVEAKKGENGYEGAVTYDELMYGYYSFIAGDMDLKSFIKEMENRMLMAEDWKLEPDKKKKKEKKNEGKN